LQISYVDLHVAAFIFSFSASTPLVGCQEENPACKNWVMMCWHGYLFGARCKWFAHDPADATAILSSLASLKSRMVLPFWCRLTQVVLEKRPLHECMSVCLGLAIYDCTSCWCPWFSSCIVIFVLSCILFKQLLDVCWLWPPYVIGQSIIFFPCSFFFFLSCFSSPNLSRHRLDVCHTSTHGVALVRI